MIQTVLRQVCESLPATLNLNPADLIDNRYIQTLDQQGLFADLNRTFKPR